MPKSLADEVVRDSLTVWTCDDNSEIREEFVEATLWHQIEARYGSSRKLIDISVEEVESDE